LTHVQAIANIDPVSLLDTLASFGTAFVLGALIGIERQYRQRTAGLRTTVLVAVGAAAFVDLGNRLNGVAGATQIAAYVVSGVGFLGAGVIMKGEGGIRGLNTAATLWGSAAVGAFAGADLILEACVASFFVLAGNTMLRPLVNWIDRIPLNVKASEAIYGVSILAARPHEAAVREHVQDALEHAKLPVRSFQAQSAGDGDVQLLATLLPSSIDAGDLDRVVGRIAELDAVKHAFWHSTTLD
jgi:putative Mg2+ transporter-C (MgtC) family protein